MGLLLVIGAITAFVIVGRQPYLRPPSPIIVIAAMLCTPMAVAAVVPVFPCRPPGADIPLLLTAIYTALITMICGCRDYTVRNLGIAIGGVIAATVWAWLAMSTSHWWW